MNTRAIEQVAQRSKREFTFLELALVSIIVGMLMILALNRLLDLLVDMERVQLLQTEASIKSALGLELSRRVVEQELHAIGDLEGSNPLELLQEMPNNYLGVRPNPNLATLPKGSWVFDSSRRVLIYIVNHADHFSADLPGRSRAEYRLALDYQDNNRNGRFDYRIDRLTGLSFAPLGRYRWQRRGSGKNR